MTTTEQAEAKKLGFNPPARRELPSTTNIVGFFNPHAFPVHIAVSEFNISFTLTNRGEYIVDPTGRKINDPIFERYVSPNGLAREMSENPVPVLAVALREHTPASSLGFTATQDMKKGPGDTVEHVFRPQVATVASVPAMNTNPIGAMSMDEARRRGLAAPTRAVREDAGVDEKEAGPGKIPEIPIATDLPYRKNKALTTATSLPAALVAPENPSQARVIEALQRASTVDVDDPNLIAKVTQPEEIITDVAPAGHTGPKMTTIANLPAPDLGEPVEATESSKPVSEHSKRFICSMDGKRFQYRSELDRYVKRVYPDNAAELLLPYPEGKRKVKA